MSRRRLVVLRGPGGVGKSTLAIALRERLGYPTAAIDTDLFNWSVVPGEFDKRVVYDNICLLVESYLRYDYDVVLSGLILTTEEQGAMASLRAKANLLGGAYWDFYCHAPLDVVVRRSAERSLEIPAAKTEEWWHGARADVARVAWPVRELDMEEDVAVNVEKVIALLDSRTSPPNDT